MSVVSIQSGPRSSSRVRARPARFQGGERALSFQNRAAGSDLVVERRDLVFRTVSQSSVEIAVRVRNRGALPSSPTPLVVRSAPFGVFVETRPLAVLTVPSLAPGEATTLSLSAERPASTSGDFRSFEPRELLTAGGASERVRERARGLLQRGLQRTFAGARGTSGRTGLASDLLQVFGRGDVHWIGNIDVFVGLRHVERHVARALRVVPGARNIAFFCLGTGADAYAFRLAGDAVEWDVELASFRSQAIPASTEPGAAPNWFPVVSRTPVIVALSPPAHATTGELAVHVTQRSTGREAAVEFSLDASAQGPGCYTL